LEYWLWAASILASCGSTNCFLDLPSNPRCCLDTIEALVQKMLKLIVAVMAFAALASAAPTLPSGKYNSKGGLNWVLLIAGSNSYGNYRHQADIYHAYQVVKKNGVPDANIIVFHYDDIASSSENPHKGTVINNPKILTNVYAGVPKDYTGFDVTPTNILAVLAGNASALDCQGGKQQPPTHCSKKVIASGPQDDVFVMFDDHGGAGILGMPDRDPPVPYLYANDINRVLKAKAAAHGFHQLTFYIEACEAGSIFDGLLPANINIYATTASNPDESSWGCYCPGMDPPPPPEYETCLGDLYAVSVTEHADATDESKETLSSEYNYLKIRVSQNGTYSQGSHVMQYGQTSIDSEPVSTFLGNGNKVLRSCSATCISISHHIAGYQKHARRSI
jgi:legumain